jgi:NADPH2:quinone reductase
MRAIAMNEAGRFELASFDPPHPEAGQVLVSVRAVSLNRGEVLRARAERSGFRPGWDFAGIVTQAGTGTDLELGTRVAGYLPSGAWAETVAVAPRQIAAIPEGISFLVAASLPVAGLTALGAIDAGGSLVGRKVLVTGATGGVGIFAVYLASLGSAEVTAAVRRPVEECRRLFPASANIVSGQSGVIGAAYNGPFHLVVETLGGAALGEAMAMLSHSGKCVTLGVTDGVRTSFDAERFFMTGNASLEGFVLFRDRLANPSEGMERLLRLVASGKLPVMLGHSDPWQNIEAVAEKLMAREFLGKAVLTLEEQAS